MIEGDLPDHQAYIRPYRCSPFPRPDPPPGQGGSDVHTRWTNSIPFSDDVDPSAPQSEERIYEVNNKCTSTISFHIPSPRSSPTAQRGTHSAITRSSTAGSVNRSTRDKSIKVSQASGPMTKVVLSQITTIHTPHFRLPAYIYLGPDLPPLPLPLLPSND